MARFLPPYLRWRDGRPRWEPGPGLRRRGAKGRDLRDEAGAWLGLEAAIAEAKRLNAASAGTARVRPPRPPRHAVRTCRALADHWRASVDYERLAPATRADYGRKLEIWLADFGEAPVAAVRRSALLGFWEACYRGRGHAMANGVVAVVRACLSHAVDLEWLEINPALRMGRPGTRPRLVLWSPEEVEAVVAAADAMGLASIGDAVVVALHSGQREADVLHLPPRLFEGGVVRLTQRKTGTVVEVPVSAPLRHRLDAIRRRWSAAGVIGRPALIVAEATGRPYKADHFRHVFAEVRAAAADRMPALAGKWFMDLRDTAVTRLALAGCTLAEISSITGHQLDSIHQIMNHYLVLGSPMARAAMGKLQTWMAREGVRL